MKFLVFLAVTGLVGCAEAEPFGSVQPFGTVPGPGVEDEVEDDDTIEPNEWSVEVNSGSTYRLRPVEDGAVVLAALAHRTSVTRFELDGRRRWTIELPQFDGGSPVELGASRDGRMVVLGSPSDGGEELVVVRIDEAGTERWTREVVGDWGRLEARGVALHHSGTVAVLAQEFAETRPVRTALEFFTVDGRSQARENFSEPGSPAMLLADSQGFVAVGDRNRDDVYAAETWARGYDSIGVLVAANVLAVQRTGVWTRELAEGHEKVVWIAGMIDPAQACAMPAFESQDSRPIEETPALDPLAMSWSDNVLAIEDGAVAIFPYNGARRWFVPDIGTARQVAAGPHARDPVYVLSHDEVTYRTRLHGLEDP